MTEGRGDGRLRLAIDGEPWLLSVARHALVRWLETHRWHRDDVDDLVFAISEAVSNSIEHAYRGAETGRVSIELELRHGHDGPAGPDEQRPVQVRAVVTDCGSWRPAGTDRRRGNGVPLMRAMTDTVEVTTDDAGTRVAMWSRPVVPLPAA